MLFGARAVLLQPSAAGVFFIGISFPVLDFFLFDPATTQKEALL